MKRLSLTLALLLLLVTALLVTSCGGGGEETPTDAGESTADTAPVDTTADVPTEPETAPESTPADETDAPDTVPETLPETDPETQPEETSAPVAEGYRPGQEVRVMSFNLSAEDATVNKRSAGMIRLLTENQPDSIGVQECRGSWTGLLKKRLGDAGYARVGVDAGGNKEATGGYFATYIFYREDKYKVVDTGTFWLSETPDVPSIYGPTVDCNRTCTWVILENKETGFRYVHMNCHTDWMDPSVTVTQCAMVRDQILRFEAMGYPVFATGDYNNDEGDAPYKKMLESDHIADSKFVAGVSMDIGTYPDYGKYDVTKSKPIDFVFVTKNMMTVNEYRVVENKVDGVECSDHNGLYVVAEVASLPDQDLIVLTPAISGKPAAESAGATAAVVTFPQATDKSGACAKSYIVTVTDPDGKEITSVTVNGGMFRVTPASELSVKVTGLTADVEYTIAVKPVSLLGREGHEVKTTVVCKADVKAEPIDAADLVNVIVGEDGLPVDTSPNAFPLTKIGTVGVTGNELGRALVFTKQGNYKMPGFKSVYDRLTDGFTVDAYVTTGSDITTYQNFAANFHAGGFGFEIESGKLFFSIRVNGAYVSTGTEISANKSYYVAAVYACDTVNLYVDGALVDSITVSGAMGLPTDEGAKYLCIGGDSDASGNGESLCECSVNFVRVWSEPASAGQILYLWLTRSGETAPAADLIDLSFADGKAVDVSPRANAVTPLGQTVFKDGVAVFSADSNLKIPGMADMYDEVADGFTQELVFSCSKLSGECGIFSNLHAGGFGFYVEDGNLLFYLRAGGSYTILSHEIDADVEYHAVAVWDHKTVRLFLDGEEVESSPAAADFVVPTDPNARYMCLGADSDASGKGEYPFTGTISAARLWSEPLTDEQIMMLFMQ